MGQNFPGRVALPLVAAIVLAAVGVAALAVPGKSAVDAAAPAKDAAPASPRRRPSTQHDLYADVLAFNRRTLVGAYERAGKRNPKWDKQAVEFLETAARYFSVGRVHEFYLPAGERPTRDAFLALGDAAMKAGCDDPLVLYCQGAVLTDVPDVESGRPLLLRADEGLQKGDYPVYRLYASAHRMEVLAGPADAAAAARAADLRVKMFSGKLDDIARRAHFWLAWKDAVALGRPAQVKFVAAMQKARGSDPWARDLAAGLLHIDLAWDSRGGAFADAVGEAQWAGFRKNLAVARDHLTRAWKLAPQLPEAAEAMITLSMGGGEDLGEKPLDWFERAQAAQVDSPEAYGRMRLALTPRWGGSHEEMLELANACVEVGRYDTMVPWEFIVTLWDVRKDAGVTWSELLADEAIYAQVVRVAKGYAAAREKTPRGGAWYATYHAAAAWRAGKYDEARGVLETLGKAADPTAFAGMAEEDGKLAIADIYAKSGSHAAAIAEAEAMLDAGDAAGAATRLKALRDKVAGDPSAVLVGSKLRVADWRLRLDTGQWLDVQPVETLAGWGVAAGKWRVEGDALVSTSDPRGETKDHQRLLAWTAADLGDAPFELTGSVEFTVEPGPGKEAGNFGFAIKSPETRYTAYLLFDRDDQKWYLSYFGLTRSYEPVEVGATNEFVFRRAADGTLSADLNGKPVASPFALPGEKFPAPLQFGVGGLGKTPVRYKNLRLRKIVPPGAETDAPPPDPAEPTGAAKPAAPEPAVLPF